MSYFVSPEFLRVLLLGFITSLHMTWRRLVNHFVPGAYLDEVFHVPQAQAYWSGQWSRWDPKITTPPGLYVWSYAVNSIRDLVNLEFNPGVNEFRATNVVLLYLLLVALYVLTAVGRKKVDYEGVLQREFSIALFPLIFFFSVLYYTDLLSVFTVVLTHICWSAGLSAATGKAKVLFQCLHLVIGLASLAARQTNVFWVAVYLGGLQVVESVKANVGVNEVHDPPVSEAYFEDFPITSISIAQAAVSTISRVLLDLWPQLCLLLSFGAFVVWNGGVVLGDKDNHVATVHLPQMLYIWPLIVFFSWPVLLPQLNHLASFRRRLPRLNTTITWIVLMLVTVNLNTVVHPFTLADNRHYTFYVFRLLRQHWLGKYAAVPVYYLCACLVLGALGGATTEPAPTHKSAEVVYSADTDDTICVSFVLVWLVATSLSLVTAPLVEPRYFILPWLMWRLAVPEHIPRSNVKAKVQELENKTAPPTSASPSQDHPAPALSSGLQRILATAASYSASLELVWYVLVNLATCYMFLFKGFEWLQEPDSVQRFMW